MNEYAYPHSEEVQHQHSQYRPERATAAELLDTHPAAVLYRAGFSMADGELVALEYVQHCIEGAIEAATWDHEHGTQQDPNDIARDVLSGSRALVATWDTWQAFVGLYGWRVAADMAHDFDGEPWAPSRLTEEAADVVAYVGHCLVRYVLSVLDLEGVE
jgi:hypothetical protein